MKNVISYLKLDFRISKKILLMMMPIITLMLYIFLMRKGYTIGMSYFLLILVVLATIPFSKTAYEKIDIMYNTFPVKNSEMVFGRYIYITLWILLIFIIEALLMFYLHESNGITDREIVMIFLCEVIATVICFVEGPIFYMIENENNTVSSILHGASPLFIFFISSFMIDNKFISNIQVNFMIDNKNIIIVIIAFLMIFIGYVSYLISCEICKRKEV